MDQFYYEEGYIEAKYYVYVASAKIDLTPYIDEGYIEASYYEYYGSTGTLICDAEIVSGVTVEANGSFSSAATLAAVVYNIKQFDSAQSAAFAQTTAGSKTVDLIIDLGAAFTPTLSVIVYKNYTAIIDSITTMTVDAVANRSANITLDSILNVSSQAVKTVDITKTLSAEFTQTATGTHTHYILATLQSESTLTADALNVQFAQAALTTNATLSATGYLSNRRPRVYTVSGSAAINTSTKKWGAGSLYVPAGSYAYMGDSADWDNWATIDFWHYSTSTNTQTFISQGNTGGNTSWSLQVVNNRYFFNSYNSGGTQLSTSWDIVTTNTFNHVRLIRNGTSIFLYVNGTKLTPISGGTIPSSFRDSTQPVYIGDGLFTESGDFYIDELLIRNDLALGNGSASTITVPTDKWLPESQGNILVLSHFDIDLSDDLGLLKTADSTQSATFTQSTTAFKITEAMSGQNVQSTVSILTTNIIDGQAQLVVEGFQVFAGTRIQQAQATLSSEFTQTTVAGPVRDANAALYEEVTLVANTNLSRIREASAAFSAFNTELIEGMRVRLAQANLTTTATVSASADRIRGITRTLSVTTTLTADGRAFEGNLNITSWLFGIRNDSSDIYWWLEDFVLDETNEIIYELMGLNLNTNNFDGSAIVARKTKTGEELWAKFYQFDRGQSTQNEAIVSNLIKKGDNLYWAVNNFTTTAGWSSNVYRLNINTYTLTSWTSPIQTVEKITHDGTDIYLTGWQGIAQVNWAAAKINDSGTRLWHKTGAVVTNQPHRGYGISVLGNHVYLAVNWDLAEYSQYYKLDKSNGDLITAIDYNFNVNNLIIDSQSQMWVSGRYKFARLNTDLTIGLAKQSSVIIDDIAVDPSNTKIYVNASTSLFRANYINNTVDWASTFSDDLAYTDNDEPKRRGQIEFELEGPKFYWTQPYNAKSQGITAVGRFIEDTGGLYFTNIPYRLGLTGNWSYSQLTAPNIPSLSVFTPISTANTNTLGSANLGSGTSTTEIYPSYSNYRYVYAVWAVGVLSAETALSLPAVKRFRGYTANPTANFTQTTTGNVARLAQSNQSSEFTQTTAAVKTVRTGSTANIVTTVTADVDRRRVADSNMSVTATISATGRVIRRADASLTSTATQNIDYTRIRLSDSILEVAASTLTAAAVNATGTILMESTASMVTAATVFRDQAIPLSAEFAQTASGDKTVDFQIAVTATAAIVTDNIRVRFNSADITSTAAIEINTAQSKITGYAATISSEFNQNTATEQSRIRFSRADLATEFQQITEAMKVKESGSIMQSAFTGVFFITKLVNVEADFLAFNTVVTVGTVFNIPPELILTVPSETRTIKVLPESRIIQVPSETRVNIILRG